MHGRFSLASVDNRRFFRIRARTADTILVYFAGHGATRAGRNYVFPTDFGTGGLFNLDEAIAVESLLLTSQSELSSNLVFFDACRENVVQSQLAGATRGHKPQATLTGKPRTGTLITFATTPGQIAYDGAGRHSPFTGALLDHLATPSIDIELMLKRVRRDVVLNSNGLQVPWTESALLSDFYLVPQNGSDTAQVPRPQRAALNRPLSSVLSDAGFEQKPILEQIAAGLGQNSITSHRKTPVTQTNGQSSEVLRLLCSIIEPPLPADCPPEN